MLLLLTQTALISARRIDLHRRLGIAGFVLACLVVVLGILAVATQLTRFAYAKDAILTFTAPEFAELFNFAVLAGLAFALRRKAAAHKRLVLLATIGLMGAALARWPSALIQTQWLYVIYLLLGLIAIYDLWTTHRIHPATIWGSSQIVLTMWAARLLGPTETWHIFARWVQSWGLDLFEGKHPISSRLLSIVGGFGSLRSPDLVIRSNFWASGSHVLLSP